MGYEGLSLEQVRQRTQACSPEGGACLDLALPCHLNRRTRLEPVLSQGKQWQ